MAKGEILCSENCAWVYKELAPVSIQEEIEYFCVAKKQFEYMGRTVERPRRRDGERRIETVNQTECVVPKRRAVLGEVDWPTWVAERKKAQKKTGQPLS